VSFDKEANDRKVDVFASFFRVLYVVEVRLKSKDSCGRSLPKEYCLMLNLSTVSWVIMMAFVSLGRVSDRL
jgi:hypothetical protein